MWSLHHVNLTGGSVEWKFKEIPVADLEAAVRCVSVSQCGQRLVTGGGNEAFFSFNDVGVVLVWNLLLDNQVRYPMRSLGLRISVLLPDSACATMLLQLKMQHSPRVLIYCVFCRSAKSRTSGRGLLLLSLPWTLQMCDASCHQFVYCLLNSLGLQRWLLLLLRQLRRFRLLST